MTQAADDVSEKNLGKKKKKKIQVGKKNCECRRTPELPLFLFRIWNNDLVRVEVKVL